MIILDTNVVSELTRRVPSTEVLDWVIRQTSPHLYLTAVSEAELRFGAEILPLGRRRDWLLAEMGGMFREDFAGRILPFDSSAARSYAAIAAARRARGRPISHADCQIAAIARSLGAAIATRNIRDFEDCGVELLNPWSEV